MHTNSRLAVGSPTWRLASIIPAVFVASVLIIGVSFAGSRLLAKDGFIVAADGSGTHTSIAAAVADAEPGLEIFVRPGTYEEALELDKTVSLIGDGPPDEIVVTAPEGGPTVPVYGGAAPYAIHVTASEPTMSGMTFRGRPSRVIVTSGTATLKEAVFEDVGWAFEGVSFPYAGSSVIAQGPDAHLVVRDSEMLRGGAIAIFEGALGTIESNRLAGGPHLFLLGIGAGSTVSGNDVSGTTVYGLNVHGTSGVTIEGNTFADSGEFAIRVDGGDGVIARNIVVGGETATGISILSADGLQLIGNVVTKSGTGVSWQAGTGTIEGNDVSGNAAGILILAGSPTVNGNVACDNANTNVDVLPAARPVMGENDFCPEPVDP